MKRHDSLSSHFFLSSFSLFFFSSFSHFNFLPNVIKHDTPVYIGISTEKKSGDGLCNRSRCYGNHNKITNWFNFEDKLFLFLNVFCGSVFSSLQSAIVSFLLLFDLLRQVYHSFCFLIYISKKFSVLVVKMIKIQ